MTKQRFRLIEGGKGRKPKPKRKPSGFQCGRCSGRAYVHVFLSPIDGEGRPRRFKQCAQCLHTHGVDLT
jgi:hypothetical protein